MVLPYFEQGAPKGIPLVLVHGFTDSWHTFEQLFPWLPDWIHVLALTQRGHGDASKPASGYWTADFETDLKLFLDALQIQQAFIIGASSGGFTARRFAAEHAEQTLGLILLGTPATFQGNPTVQAFCESTLHQLTDPVAPEFVRSFIAGTFSPDVPSDFVNKMVLENLKVPARVWWEACQGFLQESFPDHLDQIKSPTLVIWGEQDTVLDRNSQEALTKAIPDAKLLVYPDAYHLLYWDQPERLATDLAGFIQETEIKASPRP